jgi:hypothetical protein
MGTVKSVTCLLCFLLELFDGSLVNATAFVDEMAGGRRLARIDVTNYDDIYMSFLGTHDFGSNIGCTVQFRTPKSKLADTTLQTPFDRSNKVQQHGI